MTIQLTLCGLSFAAWLYLITARGGFWRASIREELNTFPQPPEWPPVVAVIPARNEADVIEESLASVLRQTYPGSLRVVLVDDQSDDGTADRARAIAKLLGAEDRLTVL